MGFQVSRIRTLLWTILSRMDVSTRIWSREGRSIEWYFKSAEQGNSFGQYHLGYMYEYGDGVEKDDEKGNRMVCQVSRTRKLLSTIPIKSLKIEFQKMKNIKKHNDEDNKKLNFLFLIKIKINNFTKQTKKTIIEINNKHSLNILLLSLS